MLKTKSFKDREGNRFVFPSLILDTSKEENSITESDIIFETLSLSLALGRAIDLEDWMEFDRYNFPHIDVDLEASCFLHGAATVWVFEGPLLEEFKLKNTDIQPIEDCEVIVEKDEV